MNERYQTHPIDYCTFCDDATGFFTDGYDGMRCSMCQNKAAIQHNYYTPVCPVVVSDKAVLELEKMWML